MLITAEDALRWKIKQDIYKQFLVRIITMVRIIT